MCWVGHTSFQYFLTHNCHNYPDRPLIEAKCITKCLQITWLHNITCISEYASSALVTQSTIHCHRIDNRLHTCHPHTSCFTRNWYIFPNSHPIHTKCITYPFKNTWLRNTTPPLITHAHLVPSVATNYTCHPHTLCFTRNCHIYPNCHPIHTKCITCPSQSTWLRNNTPPSTTHPHHVASVAINDACHPCPSCFTRNCHTSPSQHPICIKCIKYSFQSTWLHIHLPQ